MQHLVLVYMPHAVSYHCWDRDNACTCQLKQLQRALHVDCAAACVVQLHTPPLLGAAALLNHTGHVHPVTGDLQQKRHTGLHMSQGTQPPQPLPLPGLLEPWSSCAAPAELPHCFAAVHPAAFIRQ